MPTISGVWKWNDRLTSRSPGGGVTTTANAGTLYYTSGNAEGNGNTSASNISVYRGGMSGYHVELTYFGNIGGTPRMNKVVYYDPGTEVEGSAWVDESYKTINFGDTEQEVNSDFYNWFTYNATKQEEPVVPTTTKTVSSDNLARFKQKCDETYAAIGNIPTIPTPTTSDNGKVLGVANGAYALQEASGGTQLYRHELSTDQDGAYSQKLYVFTPTAEEFTDFSDALNDFYAISYKGVIQLRKGSGVDISYETAVMIGYDSEGSKAVLYNTATEQIVLMTGAEIDANVSWMGDYVSDIDKI